MNDPAARDARLKELLAARRKATRPNLISGSLADLIEAGRLGSGGELPLVIRPRVDGVQLSAWAATIRPFIESSLLKYGGLLFRGFSVRSIDEFESFAVAISGGLLEYKERSSPRTQVKGNVYTSTDYPADQAIFLHNENSYQSSWPMKILFFCQAPAQVGGETPIADCRKVVRRIDPLIRDRFMRRHWMYVRNFGDGFGLAWQTVFQTTDKAAVEAHCRANGIAVEWKRGDRLRLRTVMPAMTQHPKTGEMVWFNHATFFHVSTLERAVRERLMAEFEEEDLPSNTYYGDGGAIEDDVAEHLRAAYESEKVAFEWERGDVLLLDNMLVAHGRSPYAGERKVLVAMCDPYGR